MPFCSPTFFDAVAGISSPPIFCRLFGYRISLPDRIDGFKDAHIR